MRKQAATTIKQVPIYGVAWYSKSSCTNCTFRFLRATRLASKQFK